MSKLTLERLIEIWDDDTGAHMEIGPDRDGLGLIEIRDRDEVDRIVGRISMTVEEARLLVDALVMVLKDKPNE